MRRTIHGQIGRTFGKVLEKHKRKIEGQAIEFEIRTQKEGGKYRFYATYAYGGTDYEVLGPKDEVKGLFDEMVGVLEETLKLEWTRHIYIKVEVEEPEDTYYGRVAWASIANKMALFIGVLEMSEHRGRKLYRKVEVKKKGKEWEFYPQRHVTDNGPKPGEDSHFGVEESIGLIPFESEYWEKLVSMVEAMNEMAVLVRSKITGKSFESIIANLGCIGTPRLGHR